MMKSLTTALGALTILTVTGMATPPGQAMLGIRQAQTAAPVSVISDPGPAKVAAPVAPAATPATVAPQSAAPAARPAVAAPAARPVVTHPAAAPAAAVPTAAPAANPMGGAGAIANILLNLPQVLQGTQGVPGVGNSDEGMPPGQRAKRDKKHPGDSNNAGDYEH